MIDKDLKLVVKGMKQMWKSSQDTWISIGSMVKCRENPEQRSFFSALKVEHLSDHHRWRMSVDSL
jgi:hypothetical protein